MIAGMVSFPRAMGAGIVLGITEALIRFNFQDQAGLIDFVLFLAVVVAVFFQSRSQGSDASSFSFAPRVRPVPQRVRQIWWVRNLGLLVGAVALAVAIAVPLLITEASRQLVRSRVVTGRAIGDREGADQYEHQRDDHAGQREMVTDAVVVAAGDVAPSA